MSEAGFAESNGGGGSRTPVRKYSTVTSTCLAQDLNFAFQISLEPDIPKTIPS